MQCSTLGKGVKRLIFPLWPGETCVPCSPFWKVCFGKVESWFQFRVSMGNYKEDYEHTQYFGNSQVSPFQQSPPLPALHWPYSSFMDWLNACVLLKLQQTTSISGWLPDCSKNSRKWFHSFDTLIKQQLSVVFLTYHHLICEESYRLQASWGQEQGLLVHALSVFVRMKTNGRC